MPRLLITTKLNPPPVRAVRVNRHHLIQKLNAGIAPGCKLILLSAAAGSGKTTLVSEWIADTKRPVAWVALDEGDNDIQRFWLYIIAALQRVYPGIADDAAALIQSSEHTSYEPILTLLLNALSDLHEDTFLVLEDFHTIELQEIHQSFAYFLERLPPQFHLVMTTRIDPPVALGRLRSRGEVVELRGADLRFSVEEVETFFRDIIGFTLPAENIQKLEAHTEGWVAGLQLAGLSMKGLKRDEEIRQFIHAFTGSHRHIVDYLVEEVLHRQDEDVLNFLLKTSILRRLNAPLCEAVAGQPEGQKMLEWLERANLFTIPLDHERNWYRYHTLFADLLRSNLAHAQTVPIADLHRRAARWYEQNQMVDEAIHHALAAKDFEVAARVVIAHTSDLFAHGEFSTLQTWLSALPRDVILSYPRLCIDQARLSYLNHRLTEMYPLLDAAELLVGASADAESSQMRGEILSLRGYLLAEKEEFREAIRFLQDALQLLPPTAVTWRANVLMYIAHAYFKSGNPRAAIPYGIEANEIFRSVVNLHGAMTATGLLGMIYWIMGHLLEAKSILESGLQWAARNGRLHLPPVAGIHNWLGKICLEQNDLKGAEDHLHAGLELAKLGRPLLLMRAFVFWAQFKHALGETATAESAMQNAVDIAQVWETPWARWFVQSNRVRLWLRQGNLSAAIHWAQHESKGTLQSNETPTYYRLVELVTLTRVWLAQASAHKDERRLLDALALLDDLHDIADTKGQQGMVIEINMLKSIGQMMREESQSAVDSLSSALTMAESEGYVRLFMEEGEALVPLLTRIGSSKQSPGAYAQQLLSAIKARGISPRSADSGRPAQAYVDQLSERELEVLRLLADGLESGEIADRLIIAVETARKHIKNIYSKLDVHSRWEAIKRAEELRLL